MDTTATKGMATMFGNAAAKDATCHSDDRRCAAGTKSLPQSCIDSNPTPIVTSENTTTNTVSLSSFTLIDAPVVETIREGIMTAADSLEMRVIASLLNMGRSLGRFAAVAPIAATITNFATTPNARSSISPSMSPIVRRAAMNARTDTATCKSIDEAPVGYYCSNGAALAPRRHCESCT